jgi:hypothetical protein
MVPPVLKARLGLADQSFRAISARPHRGVPGPPLHPLDGFTKSSSALIIRPHANGNGLFPRVGPDP